MWKRWCILCIACLVLAGCGTDDGTKAVVTGQYYHPSDGQETQTATEQDTEKTEISVGTDLYLIVANDMTAERLTLRQVASGRQFLYSYSLSTAFRDQYGDTAAASEFEPGRAVHVGEKDHEGRLLGVQIADEVWEYSDIVRYSVDTERGIFKIADSNYSYDEDLLIVSDGEKLALSALDGTDEIRVAGIGKKILSVSVTAGHGTLALTNTDIFEGSYIQVGTKIFAKITPDMELEIPEGTYTVTVANNGYGGSTEIVIARGETLTLDLDDLKGEGPKSGQITFLIDAEDAVLEIDGKEVDYSEPVELTYGVHSVSVRADGYEDFDKKLFVSSAEAEIEIELTESGETSETESVEATETQETTDTTTGTTTEEQSEDTSAEDLTTDYLTTLSDLISSVT